MKTLSALARELKATERAVAERVRYQLRGSYSHYYRRMLAPLLAALEFRCNNSAYRPVMDAIGLLARYAGTDSDQKLYAVGEKVPVDGVVSKAWLDGVAGREGVTTGDDREHAEVSMLALHLLQSSLVFINTQLLQAVLRDPAWAGKLTEEDRRGLSPLFWSHVNPYGRFRLDMDTRLDLTAA